MKITFHLWEKPQNNTVVKNKEIILTTSSSRSYYCPSGRQKLKLISTNLSLINNYKCQPDKIWEGGDDINGERYVKRTFSGRGDRWCNGWNHTCWRWPQVEYKKNKKIEQIKKPQVERIFLTRKITEESEQISLKKTLKRF